MAVAQDPEKATGFSDDPPYFGGYINANYAALKAALGLTDEDLWQMARNSFVAAYLSDQLRSRCLSELDGHRPRIHECHRQSD